MDAYPLGYDWREGAARIGAGIGADFRTYGARGGLHGLHAVAGGQLVVVYHLGRDGERLVEPSHALPLIEGILHDAPLWVDRLAEAVPVASTWLPVPGLVAIAATPMRARLVTHGGAQFHQLNACCFGPAEEAPVMHHLAAFALGLDGSLRREAIRGLKLEPMGVAA